MKKTFTKLLSLVIGMMMIMTITAMADPTDTTITVPSTDGHSYNIYQIFTGELANGVLSNIHWGKNGIGTEGALVDKDTLSTIEAIKGTDAEKAAELQTYADLTGDPAYTVASGASVTVKTGYYLIKDATAPANLAQGDEATLYIVQVVGPTEIERKAGTTTSDKKLDDKNDSDPTNSAVNATMDTSSDYDIGDEVPYHVKATISSKVGQYKKYHITLEDILEDGKFDAITLDKDSIILGDDTIAETADYTVNATWGAEPTKAGFKVTYTFVPKEGKTLDSLAGKEIKIDFTAKLGKNAAIGSAGNRNTLKVSYSNNPNSSDDKDEGHAPDKVVITFVYRVVVDKVDEKNQPLANAGFTLYKVLKTDAEAGVPATNATDAKSKNAYWETKALATNGTWTAEATKPEGSNVSNRFSFDGIDDGYYVLCETTTPAGYNTIDPQVFKVEATHGGTDGITLTNLSGTKLEGSSIEFNKDTGTGTLSTTIVNEKGTTLPSTGGMGTTLFYIIGGILVAAAAIILVSKKRAAQ